VFVYNIEILTDNTSIMLRDLEREAMKNNRVSCSGFLERAGKAKVHDTKCIV
jgi:hypothetical protein